MFVVDDLNRTESHNNLLYKYYYRIIKNRISFSHYKGLEIQSYGIEIERQDYLEGKLIRIERDSIKSISPYKYKVYEMLKMLYDNVVSPFHLIDILGDYVDVCVIDFEKILKEYIP